MSPFSTQRCLSDRTWEPELALVLCEYGRYRAVTVDTSIESHLCLHTQTWRMASAQTIKSWVTFSPPVLSWVTKVPKVSAGGTRRSRFCYLLFLWPLGIWLVRMIKLKIIHKLWDGHLMVLPCLPVGLFQVPVVTEMKIEFMAAEE